MLRNDTDSPAAGNPLTSLLRKGIAALPAGTAAVGLGLIVSGAAVYGYLGITARVLGPEAYAPLAVLWSLVFIMGPGMFIPLEQEVGRTFAGHGIASPIAGSVLRRGAVLGAALSLAIVTLALAFSSVLLDHLFAGQSALLYSFCLAVPAFALIHLMRGVLAGQAQFSSYALLIGSEGAVRLVAAGALAVLGSTAVGGYAVLIGAAPVFAVLLVGLLRRPHVPPTRERVSWRHLAEGFGYLLIGSLVTQTLINVGPIAVQILAGEDDASAAGRLLAGIVLCRIPLYMFQAVQASLLPKLAALGAAGDDTGFRSGMARLLLAIAGLTVIGLVVAATIGPALLTLLFGEPFALGRLDLVLLTLSSCLMMAAQACGAALVALRRHAKAALGWLAGAASFVVVTLLGDGLLMRVELGLIAGALVSALLLGGTLMSTVAATRRLQETRPTT